MGESTGNPIQDAINKALAEKGQATTTVTVADSESLKTTSKSGIL